MQKVVGEILKSACGRRLLAYYWFSISVPSSHHHMTVLWGTGAPGGTGRCPWSKQVDESTLTPSSTEEKEGEGTMGKTPPFSPCCKVNTMHWFLLHTRFPNKQYLRRRSKRRSIIQELLACFQLCKQESSLHQGALPEGIATPKSTFPVINPSSSVGNPFFSSVLSRLEWWRPSTTSKEGCSECPHAWRGKRVM